MSRATSVSVERPGGTRQACPVSKHTYIGYFYPNFAPVKNPCRARCCVELPLVCLRPVAAALLLQCRWWQVAPPAPQGRGAQWRPRHRPAHVGEKEDMEWERRCACGATSEHLQACVVRPVRDDRPPRQREDPREAGVQRRVASAGGNVLDHRGVPRAEYRAGKRGSMWADHQRRAPKQPRLSEGR